MLRPLGPVAVFGASNFPLAFSVAGGDTASALAAGCPVVVKAHPAHPGTSELAGLAILRAAADSGMPEGVFGLLFDAGYGAGLAGGTDHAVGAALVRHPAIRAVGFTGSRRGGLALAEIAAARPVPIPVYAEMSSINPVFILPEAMRDRGADIAAGLHASVTLGAGQFCTNPGLVVVESGGAARSFLDELARLIQATPIGTMLSAGICAAYGAGVAERANLPGVELLAAAAAAPAVASVGEPRAVHGQAGAALFRTDAATFLASPVLMNEVFGPTTLVVECAGRAEMLAVARALEGQLTASVHGTDADLAANGDLLEVLEGRAGRLVFNGYPTGVEVCHAMVHGGPHPATLDGRSTSVGTRAIQRFARPVCWQDCPDALLPEELREGNPLGIWRSPAISD
jgi:acyl-CoA reductase-like NAD-dependent aldehyde dehydrogenase